MTTEAYQNQIDEIIDNFEFGKVRKMMGATDWTWGDDGVPDEPDLREEARRLLKETVRKDLYCCGTGGFMAINQDGCLSLYWGLSWECEAEEASE